MSSIINEINLFSEAPLQVPSISPSNDDTSASRFKKIYTIFKEKCYKVKENLLNENTKPGDWINEDFHVPGTTTLLSFPYDIFMLSKAFLKAILHDDVDSQIDLALRLGVFPIGLLYRLAGVSANVIEFLSLFNLRNIPHWSSVTAHFVYVLNIIGLTLCFVEFTFESISLFKSFKFSMNLPNFQKEASSLENSLNHLHNNYFSISDKERKQLEKLAEKKNKDIEALEKQLLKVKENKLMHRTRPEVTRMLKELFSSDIFEHLEEGDRLEEAHKVLKLVKIQSMKKMIIHTVGALGLLLGMLSLTLILLGAPWLIPTFFFCTFFILSTTRFLLTKGMLEQEGWQFSPSACVPGFVKKGWEKITALGERALNHLRESQADQKYLHSGALLAPDHHRRLANDFPFL